MTVKIEKNVMTITIPLQTPKPSKSGKTMLVASTGGNVVTDATVNGKPVVLGLNAYIS